MGTPEESDGLGEALERQEGSESSDRGDAPEEAKGQRPTDEELIQSLKDALRRVQWE
jgi:hypothetical protein